ncbi:glycosyltransferase family 61 protein [Neorhizobium vignae]|uniref:glycosyltransferase family 61 protein n=1 Tax=Neorhizobium vignae TaxID=690585 RepID=UPI00056B843F|nr:glycosyltransferase family 61 protein [Neorhizobium vignae]
MFDLIAWPQDKTVSTVGEPAAVTRILPRNFEEKDAGLFEPNLRYDVPASRIWQLENITARANGWLYQGHSLLKDSFAGSRQISAMRRLKAVATRHRLPTKRISKGVWITDNWSSNYFHWLTDAIPRLHLAKEQDHDLHLILPFSFQFVPFVEQSLLPFDLRSTTFIPEDTTLTIEKLTLPAHTAATGNYNERLIRCVAQRYRQAFGSGRKPDRRIYISRSKAPVRRVLNEDEIAPVLSRHGFEVIQGESLSFSEQVRLLSECAMLAGPHGAGFVNMLFMVPGGSILEIHPRDMKTNNCYFTLASALSHPYHYMLADTVSKQVESHHDNMIVDPQELDRNLGRMCSMACGPG